MGRGVAMSVNGLAYGRGRMAVVDDCVGVMLMWCCVVDEKMQEEAARRWSDRRSQCNAGRVGRAAQRTVHDVQRAMRDARGVDAPVRAASRSCRAKQKCTASWRGGLACVHAGARTKWEGGDRAAASSPRV